MGNTVFQRENVHSWVVEGEAGEVKAIEPSETERKEAWGGRHWPQ